MASPENAQAFARSTRRMTRSSGTLGLGSHRDTLNTSPPQAEKSSSLALSLTEPAPALVFQEEPSSPRAAASRGTSHSAGSTRKGLSAMPKLLLSARKSVSTVQMQSILPRSSSRDDGHIGGHLHSSHDTMLGISDGDDLSPPAADNPLMLEIAQARQEGPEASLGLFRICRDGDDQALLRHLQLPGSFQSVAKRKRVSSFKGASASSVESRPHPRISLAGSRSRIGSLEEYSDPESHQETSAPSKRSPCTSPMQSPRSLHEFARKEVNQVDGETGWTALHVACKYGHIEILELLLAVHGLDEGAVTQEGWTPLHVASLHNHLEIVRALADSENFVNPLAVDCKGRTALHFAAVHGRVDFLMEVLQCGSNNIGREDSSFRSAIYYAYASGHEAVAHLLFTHLPLLSQPSRINLSGCGMTNLPPAHVFSSLTNLRELDISHNSIELMPTVLATMPALTMMKFDHNPLSALPSLYRTNGWSVLKPFLARQIKLQGQWTERCMLVISPPSVDKATLVSRLQAAKMGFRASFRPTKKVVLSNSAALQIQTVSLVKSKANEVSLHAWILGDELASLPTYQLFVHGDPMIMLVVDIKNVDMNWLDGWFQKLRTCRRGERPTPIFFVATNLDSSCSDEAVANVLANLRRNYPLHKVRGMYKENFFAVNPSDGKGMAELREQLLESVSGEQTRLRHHPTPQGVGWIAAHQWLKLLRDESRRHFLPWEEYVSILTSCGVALDAVTACTDFLTTTGMLIPFSEVTPGNHDLDVVVLDPCWFAESLVRIIDPHSEEIVNGVISRNSLRTLLPKFDNSLRYTVQKLFVKHHIFAPLPSAHGPTDQFLVPCLLPAAKPLGFAEVWPTFASAGQYECRRLYRFEQAPSGFFERLAGEALFIPGLMSHILWGEGVFLQHGLQQAYISVDEVPAVGYELQIRVRYPQVGDSAANIMRMITELVDSLLEASFPHILYGVTKLLPCPHCLTRRALTVEPFIFSYEEVITAITSGSPFVFCHHIPSPSRCVRIDKLAPDISFSDIKQVKDTDFRIDRLLGKGGFGSVYHGLIKVENAVQPKRHQRTRSSVASTAAAQLAEAALMEEEGEWAASKTMEIAVKELNISIEGSELDKVEGFGEFQREAFIMSHLHHPNLVCMFGICLTPPPPRLLMEFVPHGDLYFLLRKKEEAGEKLPMWLIRDIALDIALGMDHLHSISPPIIHRDLRSPNIFMLQLSSLEKDAKVKAKVADFGLSKMITSNKVVGVLGSWQWMAPETLDASGSGDVAYDTKADVYSFGIILWELLSVAFPFDEYLAEERFGHLDGKGNPNFHILEMKAAICNEGLRPTVPEDTPTDLKDLLAACWQRNPADRPDFKQVAKTLKPDVEFVTSMDYEESNGVGKEEEQEQRPELVRRFQCSRQLLLRDLMVFCDPDPTAVCGCTVGDKVWLGCRSGTLMVFDIRTDASWKAHEDAVYSIVYCKETNVVWTCAADGTVHLYPPTANWEYDAIKTIEMPSKMRKFSLKAMAEVTTAAGEHMWCGCPMSGSIWAWDVKSHELVNELVLGKEYPVVYIVQSGDTVWVASYEKIFFVNAATMEVVGQFVAHERALVTSLAVSGAQVWSAGHDGNIHVWRQEGNEVQSVKVLSAHAGKVLSFCVDHYGNVWSGSFDKTIIVWDPVACFPLEELVDVHNDSVRHLLPVGPSIWSVGEDAMIAVWEKTS